MELRNKRRFKMMSKIPVDFTKLKEGEVEKEILRIGLIAELDAINLYEQLASLSRDEKVKEVFMDIAREEKTHVGEFLTLLKEFDKELVEEIKKGEEEVKEIS